MVGQSLGHYRIVRMLGAGGMGVVYAADDTVLKRQVAIKILPASVASEPERRDRFEREALAIASLNHPANVTIYSVDLTGARNGVPGSLLFRVRTNLQSICCAMRSLRAYFTIETHRDMDLESLSNNAAFRELMRPKE
jgi:serine/threonine protein kinase